MLARRRRTNSGSDSSQPSSYSQGPQAPPSPAVAQQGSRYLRTSPPPQAAPPPPDPEMTCRDRSNEFMSAVKLLQSRQGNGVAYRQNRALQQRSEFSRIAKHIGKDLANTYTKLEKLTILAQRKSLFDDKPVEIQELTYIIKQDIKSLNEKIAQLQTVARSQKTQNGHRQHLKTHSNSVVVALQSKLATMSNDFKHVLEVRTENLKHQKNRREQFSQSAVSATATLPPRALQGHHTGSVLLQDEVSHGGEVAINMDTVNTNHYQQQQIVQEQDSYIQERADTMQSIESTIVELGSIFTQLAHMVKEQEEMVQRIDSNVDDATVNIESAHSEILKYFQSVSSNRWLMIKIFAVLIIFFIIFVVFMA
ncbi:syntaxin-5-like [Babylonia areolata]|uniref:syntaxin-5-like n=1 Tax=Babylonia areolata TaxID=304850 RepID=UPI003FD4A17D